VSSQVVDRFGGLTQRAIHRRDQGQDVAHRAHPLSQVVITRAGAYSTMPQEEGRRREHRPFGFALARVIGRADRLDRSRRRIHSMGR
jgi:hypothetical protein